MGFAKVELQPKDKLPASLVNAMQDGIVENAKNIENAKIITGTYTGDGKASQFIELGFTPKAVFVVDYEGRTAVRVDSGVDSYGGLALPNNPVYVIGYQGGNHNVVSIDNNGFNVYYRNDSGGGSQSRNALANANGTAFHYMAIR